MLRSIVYLYLLLFFMTKLTYSEGIISPLCNISETLLKEQCNCNPVSDSDPFAEGVNLIYYKCNGINETITYPITASEGLLEVLDKNKRTIFYIPGFLEKPGDQHVQLLIDALCRNGTNNVVLLDWSKYSTNSIYWQDFENAEKVGRFFAASLRKLVVGSLKEKNIYIIGFSLGAHIAGIAGKCNKGNLTIPRITGLDPANPCFFPFGCYLKPTDAEMVDVIHTDMDGFGTPKISGTADYYANGGYRPQPDCNCISGLILDLPVTLVSPLYLNLTQGCSHFKAVQLYVKSVANSTEFAAVSCLSCRDFEASNCQNIITNVGYAASNENGLFYFRETETSEIHCSPNYTCN